MKIRLAAAAVALASCFTLGAAPANAEPVQPVARHAELATATTQPNGLLGCAFRIRMFCPRMR